jgi:hypothetical protein
MNNTLILSLIRAPGRIKSNSSLARLFEFKDSGELLVSDNEIIFIEEKVYDRTEIGMMDSLI